MAAPRRWIRVDVGWSRSEWIAQLEPAARLAWIELLVYVKAEGTAGAVRSLSPIVFGRMCGIDPSAVSAMLEAAEKDGALLIEDKSWTIENWPEYQETDPKAAERMRRYRADKSRLSPLRKDGRNGRNVTRNAGVTRHATETETETETEQKKKKNSSSSKKKPARPLPDDWQPNASHRTKAAERGVDCDHEAEKMRTWARANDQRAVSWDHRFHNWLLNAKPNGRRSRQDDDEADYEKFLEELQAEMT